MRRLPPLVEEWAGHFEREPHVSRRSAVNRAYAELARLLLEQSTPRPDHLLASRSQTVRTEMGRLIFELPPHGWNPVVSQVEQWLTEGQTVAAVAVLIRRLRSGLTVPEGAITTADLISPKSR